MRYVGTSNFPAWHVARDHLMARGAHANGFVCCQDDYSLLNRDIEKELVPCLQAFGLGLVPYFPLASGMLTGKYKRGAAPPEGTRLAAMGRMSERFATERNWDIVEKLEDYANDEGHTMLDFAFAWLLAKPAVASVIAGATKPEQVEANVRAAEVELSADDVAKLDEMTA